MTYVLVWAIVKLLCQSIRLFLFIRNCYRDVNMVLANRYQNEIQQVTRRALEMYYKEVQ